MNSTLISVGAGIHWASITLQVFFSSGSDPLDFLTRGMIAAAFTLLAFVSVPYLTKRHVQPLAVAAFACNVAGVASLFMGEVAPIALSQALGALSYIGMLLLMLLWGLRFACIVRTEALKLVFRAGLTSLAIHVFVIALSVSGFFATDAGGVPSPRTVLGLVSSLFLMYSQVKQPVIVTVRDFNHACLPQFAWFSVLRVIIGLCLGMFLAVSTSSETQPVLLIDAPIAASFVLAGVIGIFAWQAHHRTSWGDVVLLPFVALCTNFVICEQGDVLCALYPAAWLAWMVMSSVQLSQLRNDFGMSEFEITFYEKLLVVLSLSLGQAGAKFALQAAPTSAAFSVSVLLLAACALCMYAAHTLLQLSISRAEENVLANVTDSSNKHYDHIYQAISKQYAFSSREQEVFTYLAKGHTRSFIANQMCIAPGTVRTHTSNIYRKMGIHTKEELLDLVNSAIQPAQ